VLALRSRQLRGRAPEPAGAAALLQAAARGWLARWRQQRAGWALRYLFRRWRYDAVGLIWLRNICFDWKSLMIQNCLSQTSPNAS
jgi:hypothetical protein